VNMEEKKSITIEDLDALTDEQCEYVSLIHNGRSLGAIGEAVEEVMIGQDDKIIEAMAQSIPLYISPEITLVGGMTVRFRNILTVQTDDINAALSAYISGRGGLTNNEMNLYSKKLFLAHSLDTLGGRPFAGTSMSKEFFDHMMVNYKESLEAMKSIREKRMEAIRMIDASFFEVLCTAMKAFFLRYDSVLNVKSMSLDKAREKVKKIESVVKKSTGPLVAGQKQT